MDTDQREPWAIDRDITPDLAPIRVKFGPAIHQEIRLEVAERMLSGWRDKDPKRFGEALRDALMGD